MAASLATLVAAAMIAVPAPTATSAAATWSRNLWIPTATVFQDPYYTACTAAATMTMLNIIAGRGTGGDGFGWTAYRSQRSPNPSEIRDMTSILAFERANDTLRTTSAGSDAHGWRNALNAYGWSSKVMTDPGRRVYEDRAYRSFEGAVKAAVRVIARFGMPVGILGWAGGHAQVMTGYVVAGENPAVSSNFKLVAIYLFDPLRINGIVNRRLSAEAFRSGPVRSRFQAYREIDSPADDRWTEGIIRSSVRPSVSASEWYHRWVVIMPVRASIGPAPTPTPTPTPTLEPTPTPEPTATPTPAPDATPVPDATPTPDPAP